MKKLFFIPFNIILLIVLAMPLDSQAQRFEEGTLTLSPGLNLGRVGFYGGAAGLPLIASLEYGLHEYFGVGPYAGFVNYKYGSGAGAYNYRFITVGARGDFHYTSLLEELLEIDMGSEELDLYVAALVGYSITAYSGPDGSTIGSGLYGNRVNTGLTFGGRYYFSRNLAVFAEVGRVLYGALNVGITLKIK